MAREKPFPATTTEIYLAHILDELEALHQVIKDMRQDRTPPAPPADTVSLKEPKRGKGRML